MSPTKLWLLTTLISGVTWLSGASATAAQPMTGAQVYEARCKSCHESGGGRAPGRADLAQRPHADIVAALTTGIMAPMAAGLSAAEKNAVATYLNANPPAPAAPDGAATPASASQSAPTGREMPQIAVKTGPIGKDPMCAASSTLKSGPGDWASMGVDDASSRFQRRPGLTAADVPRLKVKWAFSMTGGGQPTVVGDWLFVTNRSGKFYALDAKSGCVRWSVDDLVARTTPMVVRSTVAPSGWATFVGQSDRIVRAFDAQTGKELWRSDKLDDHPYGVLTGSPVVAGDRLLVPISSIEEAASMSKDYACCSFRGSLAALDLKTGKLLWKTYTVDEPRRKIRDKGEGKAVSGPAGAAVWGAPSLDRKRGVAYIVTGDSYTDVDTAGSDAIMAVDLKTGAVRWRRQVTEKDNFVMGCGPTSTSGNCPTPLGPDYDFGATPVLFTLPGGKQVLVAGQKSGLVYGINPDTGALLWTTRVGSGSALGGVEWGIGSDDRYVFVPNSDLGLVFAELRPAAPGAKPGPPALPGLSALDPATGKIAWQTPAPKAPCKYTASGGRAVPCARSQSAAPGIMPGVVFEGSLDGWFRAYDSKTGAIVWEHSTTAQTYETLNGIKAQPGGGIDGMGPTIANGMVYLVSGNNGAARVGSNGVNVLLAYSPDGR